MHIYIILCTYTTKGSMYIHQGRHSLGNIIQCYADNNNVIYCKITVSMKDQLYTSLSSALLSSALARGFK